MCFDQAVDDRGRKSPGNEEAETSTPRSTSGDLTSNPNPKRRRTLLRQEI
jgi:hypothetical protein